MKSRLFRKYFATISIVILASYTFLGFILFSLVRNYTINEKKELLSSSIDDIASICEASIREYNSTSNDFIHRQIHMLSQAIDADIFVTNINGRAFICTYDKGKSGNAENDSIQIGDTVPDSILKPAIGGGYSGTTTMNGIYSTPQYVVAKPIVVNNTAYGIVFASASIQGFSSFAFSLLKIFIASAISILSFTFIVVYLLTYRMVKPLHNMSVAAKRMSEGDFSTKVPETRDDEIGDLEVSFNNMSTSLASLESMRRSFVANVSHEFKTPMTTIEGFIDGILDGTIPPENQEKYLKIVSDETKRLSRLVTTLLNLSRIDTGELVLKPSEFDLSDTVCRIILPLEKLIENKHLEIQNIENLTTCNVFADRDLITQVIYNLIDNAIKFSTDGSYINIDVFSEDNKVHFKIRNGGIGISESELPHIFERFYKSDRSRSIDKKGTGLGLYIVKTIINLHKGQITVRSIEGEYCEFEFWIPKNAQD